MRRARGSGKKWRSFVFEWEDGQISMHRTQSTPERHSENWPGRVIAHGQHKQCRRAMQDFEDVRSVVES